MNYPARRADSLTVGVGTVKTNCHCKIWIRRKLFKMIQGIAGASIFLVLRRAFTSNAFGDSPKQKVEEKGCVTNRFAPLPLFEWPLLSF